MKISNVLFASLLVSGGTALAQDPPPDDETGGEATIEGEAGAEVTTPTGEAGVDVDADAGADAAAAPTTALTLGAGKIVISGQTVNIHMSKELVGKPISFAPSVWYGVNDKITVGLTHDGGTTQWSPRPAVGAGICISGEENGCGKVYDNVSLDVLFGLMQEKFSLAAHGALDVESFDPFTLSARVGVLGRFMATEQIGIVFDPRLSIGLTERDAGDGMGMGTGGGGNKELLDIPVWLWFRANEQLGVYAGTGIAGPLDGFGDAYVIPLGFGATFNVNQQLGVGADFWLLNVGGKKPDGVGAADFRALGIRVSYAL